MPRRLSLLAALLIVGLALGADGPAALAPGNYRLSFPISAEQNLSFLLGIQADGAGYKGSFLASSLELQAKPTFEGVTVKGDQLRVQLKLGTQDLIFEGKLPTEKGAKIKGSFQAGSQIFLTALEPTAVATLDRFELDKETLAKPEAGADYFEAAINLLRSATEKKVPADEARGWATKAIKAAEPYGTKWQQNVTLKVVQALADQKEYQALALEQARRGERALEPTDEPGLQLALLEPLAKLLTAAGKREEAAEITARANRLEEREFQEYAKKQLQTEKYAGRKGKSERAVLLELFTGAECPPCVAADLAFDALEKAYGPKEVVLLQYHLHIPGPDPLTNGDGENRQRYYDKELGTPATYFNGKAEAAGGGNSAAAGKKLGEYRTLIDKLLETPAGATVTATATRKENLIQAKVNVAGLEKPGDKVRLRVALVEDIVRYRGGNGLKYHHCVVRHLIDGAEGLPLKKAADEFQFKIDLEDVKKANEDYLNAFCKANEIALPERPARLRNLSLVAFIQDDATQEVLQATRAEVK